MEITEFIGNNHFEQSLEEKNKKMKAFTVQCWINTSKSGPLFQYYDEKIYFLVEVSSNGKIKFSVKLAGEEKTVESIRGNINNSQWHQLTFVASNKGLSIFVNEKPVVVKPVDSKFSFDINMKKTLIGKALNVKGEETFFNGKLANIALWDDEFSHENIISGNVPSSSHANNLLRKALSTDSKIEQEIFIKFINDSPFDLTLVPSKEGMSDFPDVIKANSIQTVMIKSNNITVKKSAHYKGINKYVDLKVEISKSQIIYESFIKVDVLEALERGISVISSTESQFEASVRISENLVILNAENFTKFIEKLSENIGLERIITSLSYDAKTQTATSSREQIIAYNLACQLFNRRLNKKPLAIIKCVNTDDVQKTYLAAKEFNLPISVRSGGHDHEGECSGTNTILIDLIGLDHVHVDDKGLADIGPGNRFSKLTTDLANKGVMLPHGTCASVAIPGFLMGGGWGPWTRRHGMCCEYLEKVEIVLGNGDIEIIDKDNKPELLWALKGGGGMSYGIVTKLFIQTFSLPLLMIKFELEWNCYDPLSQQLNENIPTVEILSRWESIIGDADTMNLTGTNLKINGKPLTPYFCVDKVKHNCVMYGYWEGSETTLKDFIDEQFTRQGLAPEVIRIDGVGGLGSDYGKQLMGSWDRESFDNLKLNLAGKSGLPLPPDLDEPAPHKITSRLVDCQGLGDSGHKALLESLTSSNILAGNRELGLFTYVTLGAIDGSFYQKMSDKMKGSSAFPYKNKLYTIQYQTWWNNELGEKERLQDNAVYTRTNRALDWMEVSRDFVIPNTSGSFISFKDNSIPTETYFAHNYQRLIKIKEKYSKDEFNHFRKRKTII
jgi:hypothetical protein